MADTTNTQWPAGGGREFPPTHWTLILIAAQESDPGSTAALNELCSAYRPPVYAYIRRWTKSHEQAEDLTQHFFTKYLVEKRILAGRTREGPKFRSFLLTVLKRFIINEHKRSNAIIHGGGQIPLKINDQTGLADHNTPDREFDRQWALALLHRVFEMVQAEYVAEKKKALFTELQGCLSCSEEEVSYAKASKALGIDKATLRVYAQRLRARFGELLRAEIADTVSNSDGIQEEIRYLKEVLARS